MPLVYQALLDPPGCAPLVDEVALYDADPGRVAAIGPVLAGLAERARPAGTAGRAGTAGDRPAAPQVLACPTLDEALAGAQYVFCAVRVGGLRGRVVDERVALDLGLLGQETTGAGGVCYGLRGVPVMDSIATRIAARAPDAWTINFTNPAGLVTEAMGAVLGDRVIGICDSPAGLLRRVAWLLGVRLERVWFDYAGLNHLGWLRAAYVDGRDRLPGLLADPVALGRIEEGRLFGPDWLGELGMIPNEYLYYYYYTREVIAAIRAGGQTRGELLAGQQGAFYARLAAGGRAGIEPERAAAEWARVRAERDATYLAEAPRGSAADGEPAGGGYEQLAVAVMAALAGRAPSTLVLNVRNRSALSAVDHAAVVEVPCLVDGNGAHPVAVGELPAGAGALVAAVKAAERATIEAARSGSRSAAVRALALHPLVDSVDTARLLLNGYAAGHPELAHLAPTTKGHHTAHR